MWLRPYLPMFAALSVIRRSIALALGYHIVSYAPLALREPDPLENTQWL